MKTEESLVQFGESFVVQMEYSTRIGLEPHVLKGGLWGRCLAAILLPLAVSCDPFPLTDDWISSFLFSCTRSLKPLGSCDGLVSLSNSSRWCPVGSLRYVCL